MTEKDRIREMARGFQASRVLLTAVELNLFAALEGEARGSAEVAAALGTDARATDRLMNALVSLGLLEKENHQFRNTAAAREHLVPGVPGGAAEALMHNVRLWDTWSGLTESVRTGTSARARSLMLPDVATRGFIAAMHYNAASLADPVVSVLDLSGVRRVLDVGGGSGAYAMALCRANPDIEAVVFDLPNVTPLTRSYVEAAGLSGRIRTEDGNYHEDGLGRDYDLVLLSMILHSNGPEANVALLERCRAALRAGGRIVIQEFLIEEDRTAPRQAALFALNMLVGTGVGDAYTESEISGWLQQAGFTDPRRLDPPGTGTSLLVASRGVTSPSDPEPAP